MTNAELIYNFNKYSTLQPYKTWKGSRGGTLTTTSAVATNTFPMDVSGARTFGKANPLKQWRKQLTVNPTSGRGKVGVSQVIDRPGGSVRLVNNTKLENPCPDTIKTYIEDTDSKATINNCPKDICNKQRIRRSASTIICKTYSTTHKEYLRRRVRLYDQNQTLAPLNNDLYDPKYNSTYCCKTDVSGCNEYTAQSKKVIFRPNNIPFQKEGAVSSGLRIENIKYQTVRTSASNLIAPWGQGATNAAKYRGDTGAAYFNKSKFNLPLQCLTHLSISGRKPAGGVGRHTDCFRILSSDLQVKSGSVLDHMRGTGTGLLIPKQNINYCDGNGYTNNNNNINNMNRFIRNAKGCNLNKQNCKRWCVVPPISQIRTIRTFYN